MNNVLTISLALLSVIKSGMGLARDMRKLRDCEGVLVLEGRGFSCSYQELIFLVRYGLVFFSRFGDTTLMSKFQRLLFFDFAGDFDVIPMDMVKMPLHIAGMNATDQGYLPVSFEVKTRTTCMPTLGASGAPHRGLVNNLRT
jgi:hypothetical protein